MKRHLLRLFAILAVALGGVVGTSVPASAACNTPAPTTATGYEQLLRGPQNNRWYHGDSGQSVKLPNGNMVWVFGDTLSGPMNPDGTEGWGNQFVHNSAIVTEKGCATVQLGKPNGQGNPTDWVPIGAQNMPNIDDYYWANTPFMDGQNMRMFLLHEYNDQNGFHPIGADLATFNVSTGKPQLVSVQQTPGSRNYENGPMWGAAVYRDTNYTYIYGSLNKHEFLVFGNYYYVARVPNGQITNNSAWRYWNGLTWGFSQSTAKAVMSGDGGVGTSATVYKKPDGTFVMVGKQHDAFGTEIYAWTSPNPVGPWTKQPTPLVSPIPGVDPAAGEITYLGLAHPQIPLASNKLLVSWSFNSTNPSFFGDPRYGVRFTEVTQP